MRWLILIAAALWLYFAGIGFAVTSIVTLGAMFCVAVFATALAGLKHRPAAYRPGNVFFDMLFAYLIFYFTLPVTISMGWVGVLPVITAAVYYRWVGAIGLTVLNLIIQVGIAIWLGGQTFDMVALPASLILILYLVAGSVFAALVPIMLPDPTKKARSQPQQRSLTERERQRAVYDLISELSSSLNYQRVLELALDLSVRTLLQMDAPADRMKSAALLFAEDENKQTELQIGSNRGFLPQDLRTPLPGDSGILGKAINEGQSVVSKEVDTDPELSRLLGLRTSKSAYCIPLRTGLDTYGILLFVHPDEDFFVTERTELLDIVGHQAMIALQNARLYQDLAQEKERMMEIQEESRKKLARDLHDGPTQSVAAIAMRVNFARRLMERDVKAANEELFKIEDLARRTTKEIRHMLFTLRPLVLESQGLVAAFQSMAEKMRDTYNQEVIIQADSRVVESLEAGKQGVVFYIAEEAVNNARKHAQAPHIYVRLKLLREGLSLLEIEDDGLGFNVSQVDASYENRGSLGMVNMRERTELVNGVLRIDSAPGRGTRVQVVIPLNEEAADRLRHGL